MLSYCFYNHYCFFNVAIYTYHYFYQFRCYHNNKPFICFDMLDLTWEGQLKNIENKLFTGRSSPPGLFLRKGVLKICSIFTGEHPCRNVISIKLQSNFIEVTLWHGCSPVNMLHIRRIPLEGCLWTGIALLLPLLLLLFWQFSFSPLIKVASHPRFNWLVSIWWEHWLLKG